MIRAILVDDHELYRLGVTASIADLPDICIVGEAETGEEFFNLLATTPADIVLLDVMLPDISGVEIARRLKREHPAMKILAVSSENTAAVTQALLDVGIDGFISKRAGGTKVLASAIRSIMDGIEYYGKDIADIIYRIYVAKKRTAEVTSEFTEQEKNIINLCREGLLSKEIGIRLGISPRTVETHKTNIFKKLGINSTVEMLQYALKNGIIKVEN